MSKHTEQCALCLADIHIDRTLSNCALGRIYGVSETSVRRHKKYLGTLEIEPDEFFGVPNIIITSRGKTVRLPDGSYEKVTYSPAKMTLVDSLKYDDLEKALLGYDEVPVKSKNKHGSTLHGADYQLGKGQARGGGTTQTLMIVRGALHRYAEYVRRTKPEHIVYSDNGDIIENIFNVPQQQMTNDMDLTEQIRVARRINLEAIKILSPLAPRFTYLAVPSNHGAVRTTFKTQAGTTDADFGIDISYQLEDVCSEHQSRALRNVEFVRPDPLEETAVVDVANTRLAYHHGHQASNTKQGDWWARQDHGRRPGWDADILVTGHYHTLSLEHSGNGRWHIGVSSPEPGSDWFTNKSGEQSKKGLTMFDVQDGQWSNLAII